MRPGHDGYLAVSLRLDGTRKKAFRVHLLVADAFLGPAPEGMEVNHVDGDKGHAALSNLEYVTHSVNQLHAFATGLQVPAKGEGHGRHKLTDEAVREIRADRKRHTMREWARLLGVSMSAVCQAMNGQTWRHVGASR